MIGSKSDVDAINSKMKDYMNLQLPIILQDPETPKISKQFAKRLTYRYNGMNANEINVICPLSAEERQAQEYLFMVNQNIMPKTILSNPNADIFTYYIYLQKAEDNEVKDKLLYTLTQIMIETGTQLQQ